VQDIVTENDLEHLLHLLEGKDGEMEWQSMMERSTPHMAYQAWRHEPEVDSNFDHISCIFGSSFAEMICVNIFKSSVPRKHLCHY
jgi:hypothetical protein